MPLRSTFGRGAPATGQSGRVHPERRGQVGAKAKPPTDPRIPFFPQRERRVNLELVETRTFSSRVVFLRYRVAR
jgi:hypothetical protein